MTEPTLMLERAATCVKITSTDEKIGVDLAKGLMWCRACGFEQKLAYPIKLIDFALYAATFEVTHRGHEYVKLDASQEELEDIFKGDPPSLRASIALAQKSLIKKYRQEHQVTGNIDFDTSGLTDAIKLYRQSLSV